MFGERRRLKVFESIHVGKLGHDDIDFACTRTLWQFLPRRDDETHPQTRVQAVELPDHGADKRRAAERTDTDP